MMKRAHIIGLFFLGLFIVGIIVGARMRKENPYDFEVIPTNQGLLVINATIWADKNCTVTVDGQTSSRKAILPAKNKMVQFSGLKNGRNYKVSIRRNDIMGRLKYRNTEFLSTPNDISMYIILLGASVGKSWNLRGLMTRKGISNYFWGYRGYFEFDKTPLVNAVIESPIKPDTVIIKECAAYFPREISKGILDVKGWINRLRKAEIEPVLATVVPITKARAAKKPKQLQSLNEFNKALRELGAKEGLRILDLQAALSNNIEKGFLDDKYADNDGLHLKETAYRDKLDSFMVNFFVNNVKEPPVK